VTANKNREGKRGDGSKRAASGKVESLEPFIPSVLDDYGLTAAQFRIVCHVWRRGQCFEAIRTTAAICKLSVNTVRKSLKGLRKLRMIQSKERSGETVLHKPLPLSDWRPLPKRSRGGDTKVGHGDSYQTRSPKGTLVKGIPERQSKGKEGKGRASHSDSLFGNKNGDADKRNRAITGANQSPSQNFSDAELAAQCWKIARAKTLNPVFVKSFIAHHCGDNHWTIRGRPILSLRGALVEWCKKADAGFVSDDDLERSDCNCPNEIELRCYEISEKHNLNAEAVESFVAQHRRDGWTAPNRATGEVEPIRDLEGTLLSFCEKLEND